MSTAKSIEHSTHSCKNHLVSYIRIASMQCKVNKTCGVKGQEIDRVDINNICLIICIRCCSFYECIAKSPSVEERLIRCKGPAAQYANQVAPVPLVLSTILDQYQYYLQYYYIGISMPTRFHRSPSSTSISTSPICSIIVLVCQLGCPPSSLSISTTTVYSISISIPTRLHRPPFQYQYQNQYQTCSQYWYQYVNLVATFPIQSQGCPNSKSSNSL